VIYANIETGQERKYNCFFNHSQYFLGQFEKYSLDIITHLETEYDYASIMHYASTAFSKNGLPTIETKRPRGAIIGQRTGLSDNDVFKINKLYNCRGFSLIDVIYRKSIYF
jgi:hypothetical protein